VAQARLPRTEPSTELITAHKGNNCHAHDACPDPGFFGSPEAPCAFALVAVFTAQEVLSEC